jgi:osmotically-inducible protein OsmY
MKTNIKWIATLAALSMFGLTACDTRTGASSSGKPSTGVQPDDEARYGSARQELAIHLALMEHLGVSALKVAVSVEGDKATLSGTLREKADRELASEVAKSVQGINSVENKLELSPGANDNLIKKEISDAILETRIKSRLLGDTGLRAYRIEVEATNGVVSLRGDLPSQNLIDVALQTVKAIEGVKETHNLLRVSK